MTIDRLLERRLVFVTGKGGVGRTTVAAVLGLVGAGRGLRTIVATVGGRDDLRRLVTGADQPPPAGGRRRQARARDPAGPGEVRGDERELSPGLFSIGIDPQRAMEEYLRDQLPVAALADLLGSSRTFGYLAAATPGLRELLTVGKIWELGQPERRAAGGKPYDLVIVDGPATGYGVGLLAAPRTFAGLARRGPIAGHGATIHATLVDPLVTGVVGVGRAEEAAVNEVLETRDRLRAELGIELEGVIVNAVHGRRFSARDRGRLSSADAGELTPAGRRAVELAIAEDDLVRAEQVELGRLNRGLDDPAVELPFVYAAELGRADLVGLGELLEAR
jgi:hypothetical protein